MIDRNFFRTRLFSSLLSKKSDIPLALYGRNFFEISCAKLNFWALFAKLRKATISFVVSVLPHGTARLPLDRF